MDGEKKIVVSVIVLTYNHEKYIRQALDSILAQKTTFPYEILVGDDASTDSTQKILKEYALRFPDKFRLFLRNKNIGASRNAYELLMAAKGLYLASCEGDDYWTNSRKLEIQVSYLRSHPEMVGCVHPCVIINEDGEVQKNQKLEWVSEKRIFTFKDFQGFYLPGQYATFVRRNIFLSKRNDYRILYQAHTMVADRTAMMLYLMEGNIFRFETPMSCYRKATQKDGKNLTTTVFKNNQNRVREEYQLLYQMERYATCKLEYPVKFQKRRKELFAEALFQWMRGFGLDNIRTAKEIWSEDRWDICYLTEIFFHFFRKSRNYITSHYILRD